MAQSDDSNDAKQVVHIHYVHHIYHYPGMQSFPGMPTAGGMAGGQAMVMTAPGFYAPQGQSQSESGSED